MTRLRELKNSIKLAVRMANNDFKARYAGTYMGIAWAFIQPSITILIYWFIFQIAFQQNSINGVPYVVWYICGIVPWLFISDIFLSGTNSTIEYGYLVKKTMFDVGILPIVKLIVSFYVHIVFIILLFIICILVGLPFSVHTIQIIYYIICASVLGVALSYVTSALIPFLKDMGQFISVILQFGFFLTPIVWDYTILSDKLLFLFKLNPAFYIIQGYRDAFIQHEWFWNREKNTIYFWVLTIGILLIGRGLFKKLRPHFADVL